MPHRHRVAIAASVAVVALSFSAIAQSTHDAPRPLEGRALENVAAFGKLVGYVRYFHPSDEAAATDWDRFTIDGIARVESAANPDELADRLTKVFKPIAPRIDIRATTNPQTWNAETEVPGMSQIIHWQHYGVGTGVPNSLYRSNRVHETPTDRIEMIKQLGSAPIYNLGGGVSARVPLYVAADASNHTQPRGVAPPHHDNDRENSTNDRATRLADIILAWNVFQHFFPYFDVVKTDWNAMLPDALKRAAADKNERAFLDTLRWMTAALHDGHVYVMHPDYFPDAHLPIALAWIEEKLVVTAVGPDVKDIARGDVVKTFGDKPAARAFSDTEQLLSGATTGWLHFQTCRKLVARKTGETISLEVEKPDGATQRVDLAVVPGFEFVREPLPEKITEIRPGIWYVDLDRINDDEFNAALPKLANAPGVIFDLRGYPSNLSPVVLAHLIKEPITCARWNVPLVTHADREQMEFQTSNWPVTPAEPRLGGHVAFITAGSAISYAETYMGMVENYKLADIVGGTTAGTNGNVNSFDLPGGFKIGFTGMKVLKHDGSQHHAIGINPTVPVKRTVAGIRAGRDEYLERAIEVVSPK